ncbi:hypothetical protein D3C74_294570 [compost metagenome]
MLKDYLLYMMILSHSQTASATLKGALSETKKESTTLFHYNVVDFTSINQFKNFVFKDIFLIYTNHSINELTIFKKQQSWNTSNTKL